MQVKQPVACESAGQRLTPGSDSPVVRRAVAAVTAVTALRPVVVAGACAVVACGCLGALCGHHLCIQQLINAAPPRGVRQLFVCLYNARGGRGGEGGGGEGGAHSGIQQLISAAPRGALDSSLFAY